MLGGEACGGASRGARHERADALCVEVDGVGAVEHLALDAAHRGDEAREEAIGSNRKQSEAIGSNQKQSEATRSSRKQSETDDGRRAVADSSDQGPSAALSGRSHEVDDGAEDDGVEAVEGQADKRIGDAVNDRWVKGLPALLVEDVTLRHATRRGWTEAVNRW